HRVLKHGGVVYAETPFIQQVHGGRYDFTRFTDLGHRRLFRKFEEIERGSACGPGMALAWTYQYFLMSFATTRVTRALLRDFASLTSFFLKYFDSHLVDKPGTQDAASGYYFMGSKEGRVMHDRELIQQYRGGLKV
ncbi:MAG: methyltransferase type 11, partial [Gemmatimonadetes bacterium]|nr:methyltransferase type 11 [Gemmatimonadota bacterium]